MGLAKIEKKDDGTIEISVVKKTRRIRAADGTWRTLTSYDNERFVLNKRKEQKRIDAKDRREPGWAAMVQNHVLTDNKEGNRQKRLAKTPEPVMAPRQLFSLTSIGEEKSRERSRRGRHLKNFIDVPLMRKVHPHWCHGVQYMCCCDTPYFRRKCGVTFCLKERLV